MKHIIVKTHTADKTIGEVRVITKDGQPTVIKADRNVNYEFFHEEINAAPNHIITKRVGDDLHVSFEREGAEVDLIIEGFYEYEHNALIGIAENGSYYYYIPDTGEVEDYVTKLKAGEVEGQALGGENVIAPLWLPVPSGFAFPWWALIPIVPFLFIDKDGDPEPTSPVSTTPDEKAGTFNELTKSNNPVTQNIMGNDKGIDVNSLRLIDPVSGVHTNKVIVPGQGVWELKAGTDEVTFTPEKGFLANPTPINYYAVGTNGSPIESTPVSVQYPSKTTADRSIGQTGKPETVHVVSNDDGTIDPTTVRLVDPNSPADSPTYTDKLVVPGEGTWTVDKDANGVPTGYVTFTPEEGFTGDPTPINYVVNTKPNSDGKTEQLVPTPVSIEYPTHPVADFKVGSKGQPVIQNVTQNDGNQGKDVDPTSVKLIDPKNPNTPTDKVVVAGQGVWTLKVGTDEVTFTPEAGFTGTPTPIFYIVNDTTGVTLPKTTVGVAYPDVLDTTPKPDFKTGVPGQPVTQKVISNDGNGGDNIDPTSVQLIDPKTGTPSTSVTVPNEGVWTTTPTGDVTFTPNKGFNGDPTPISYTVKDKDGNTLPTTTVDVGYPSTQLTPIPTPDSKTGVPGQPVTQNVTSNDGDNGKDIDPTSVKLVDPITGTPGTSVTVPNEGVWTTTPTGDVTFTPNKDFTGDPTPLTYTVTDKNGNTLPPTTVDVAYPEKQPTPLPTPDVKEGVPGQPVTQNVTSNDGDNGKDIDPTSVKLIDPITGTPSTSVTVPNEGTWTTTPTGDVTFTPNKDFTGDPTPIPYTVTDKNGNTLPTSTVDVNYPNTTAVNTLPDSKPGERGTPVSQNVLENDGNNIDPTTVQLINPNNPAAGGTDTVVIPNEGTWTVDKDPTTGKPNGSITFTPNPGFEDDPAPINYIAKNPEGVTSKQTPVNVVYPKTPEVIVPDNPPTPANPTGMGDNEVFEGNTAGVQGTFKVVPGLSSATIKEILLANESGTTVMVPLTVSPSAPVTLNTAKGVLTITGYDSTTGDVSYVFVPKVQNHATDAPVLDQISIVVKDSNDRQGYGMLDVAILDDVPVAQNDRNEIAEDTVPNTITGSLKDNDDFGADGEAAQNPFTPETKTTEYGTFEIKEDGSYTYTLNNQSDKVNDLNNGESIVDSIVYTIKDADGDTSTAVLEVTIHGRDEPGITVPTEPSKPQVTVPGTNPELSQPTNPNKPQDAGTPTVPENTDKVVYEGNGPTEGTFTVKTDKTTTVKTITVGGTEIPVAGGTIQSTPINTPKGTIVVDSYNPETGEVKYTYDPNPQTHTDNTPVMDNIAVSIKDSNDNTATSSIDIAITDGLPAANNDKAEITEDATPNVVSGSLKDNDDFGADGQPTPNTGYTAETKTTDYGTFEIKEDGSYTYTLNNQADKVNALNNGESIVDSIVYTIKDADGDTATAVLEVTIHGRDEPGITVPTEPSKPQVTVPGTNPELSQPTNPNKPQDAGTPTVPENTDKVVYEGNGPTEGTFTVKTDKTTTVKTITVGGTEIPVAGGTIQSTPINTPKGTIVVDSYNPETGEVKYTYDPNPQTHTDNTPVMDNIAVSIKDSNDNTATSSIDIAITDGLPAANNDKAEITEDATPNVVSGSLKDNDDFGADGQPTPNTGYTAETKTTDYGTFEIKEDGSYTYTLNNQADKVNALNNGESIVDSIVYTIKDADGDTATAVLEVTIHGRDEPGITVPTEPSKPQVTVPGTNPELSQPTNPNKPQDAGTPTVPENTDKVVYEGNGPTEGTFTVKTDKTTTVKTITVGGTEIPVAGDTIQSTPINTPKGTIVVDSYNPETGEVKYTYDPNPQTHTDNTPVMDNIAVSIKDSNDNTATSSIDIAITDGLPAANNDKAEITEDATPNVVSGSLKDNDDFGADGQPTPNTGYTAETKTTDYGTFEIKEDGSYTYTLNNQADKVNALNNGESIVDSIVYTIKDADGDTATAVLEVTIHGRDEPGITVPTEPSKPQVTVPGTNPELSQPTNPNKPQDAGTPTVPENTDKVVYEGNGPTEGTFTVKTDKTTTVKTITVGGTEIPVAGGTIQSTPINTPKGTIVVDSYNPETGEVKYTYDPNPQTHTDNTPVMDNIAVSIKDSNDNTATSSIDIAITDGLPAANNDKAEITEDATPNVVSGSLKDNDDFGADGQPTPNTGYTAETKTTDYGTFEIKEDGSYTYTLNNQADKVNALNNGESIVDSIVYTIKDADGDTATAVLEVTIHGRDEPGITVPTEPSKPQVTVPGTNPELSKPTNPNKPQDAGTPTVPENTDKVVYEGNGPTEGTFTVKTDKTTTVKTITVGGTEIPVAGDTIQSTPINTPKGTIVVDSYNPETGEVKYTYDPNPQTHTDNTPVMDNIAVSIKDSNDNTATSSIDIAITDGLPAANNDKAEITEDATPNVVSGSLKDNDDFGADGQPTPNTGYTAETKTTDYGTFEIKEDGSYTYTLNNQADKVNALNNGESIVDSIVYTIKDADGDTATAVLEVTIHGRDEPGITVPTEPSKPQVTVPGTNPELSQPTNPNKPQDAGTPTVPENTDKVVYEGNGPTEGTFTVKTDKTTTVKTITVGGTEIPVAGGTIQSTPINTPKGTIVVDSYNPETGEVKYTYDPNPQTHTDNTPVMDNIAVSIKDSNDNTATSSIDIAITDGLPAANNDKAEITEDATPNVVSGSLKDNDDFGADGQPTPNTGYTAETKTTDYGTFEIKEDGSYTYTLNNQADKVNALNNGESIVDSIVYTIKDADGDTATAVLEVTIHGRDEPGITVPTEPSKPQVTVPGTNPELSKPTNPNKPQDAGTPTVPENTDKVVYEGNGPTEGTFTVKTDKTTTVKTITVGGTEIPVAGDTIQSTPINTPKGTIVVDSYNPETGEVKYTYDPNPQTHTDNTPVMDNIAVSIKDSNDNTATSSIDIAITDGLPAANNDKAEITEDATPNVVSGSLKDNDDFGADGQPTPNTGYTAETKTTDYGTFEIKEDGSYTYTLNNQSDKVNDLNNGESIVDSIVYTIKDADGDTSTAVLAVTIHGRDEPGITVPDLTRPTNPTNPTDPNKPTNPQDAGTPTVPEGTDKVVFEGDGPIGGTFTVKTDKGTTVTTINVGGTEIPVAGGTIQSTPINTPKGTIVVDSYNPETGEVKYTYDPNPQTHTDNTPVMDSIPVSIKDGNGNTAVSKIDIAITDSLPIAKDDVDEVNENTATVTGSLKPNDDFGADGQPTETTGYTRVDNVEKMYGSFTILENGEYTYTLKKDSPEVNALNDGETLTDSIQYTIKDKDGDEATAILTITIKGDTNPSFSIVATDPLAVEGAANNDNQLVFTVENNGATFTAAAKTKVSLDSAASDKTLNEADIERITVNDVTGSREITWAELVAGVEVTTPQDKSVKPTITIVAKDDNVYEISEKVVLKLSDAAYVDTSAKVLAITTNTAEGAIVDNDGTPTNPTDDDKIGDKPIVNLSGPATVPESVGNAEYTFTMVNPVNGQPATSNEEVVLTYKVTHGNTKDKNPTEAGDFADTVKIDEIITVRIPAGSSSASVSLPIVNDTVYEGAEGYTVTLVSVEGATKGKDVVETTIYDNGTTDGKTPNTPNPDPDKPNIELNPPAHVSEEGLEGGRKDTNPVGVDTTDLTVSNGKITLSNLENADAVKDNLLVKFTNAPSSVSYQGQPVNWVATNNGGEWTGYIAGQPQTDTNRVLRITLANNGTGAVNGDTLTYDYNVELFKNIDHPVKGQEDNLDVQFGVEVSEKDTGAVLLTESKIVTVVEDDMPDQDTVVHNIQVAHDRIRLVGLEGGFTDTVFLFGNNSGWLVGNGNVSNPSFTSNGKQYRVLTPISNGNNGDGVANSASLNDNDNLDDALYWGRATGLDSTNANFDEVNNTITYKTPEIHAKQPGYILKDNDEFKGTKVKELNSLEESFLLGEFTHDNWGSFSDGGALSSTNITSRFKVNINGVEVPVPDVKFPATQFDTSNGYTVEHPYSDDVIMVQQSDSYVQIGSTTYSLKIDDINNTTSVNLVEDKVRAARVLMFGLTPLVAGNPNSTIAGAGSNVTRLNTITAAWDLDGDGVIGANEQAVTLRQALQAWTDSMKATEDKIRADNPDLAYVATQPNTIAEQVGTRENPGKLLKLDKLINDAYLAAGKAEELDKIYETFEVLIFSSRENNSNNFELKAHLEPVADPTKLETSVTILDKVHFGSDKPAVATVVWGGATVGQERVTKIEYFDNNGAVLSEADKAQAALVRITSDYGVFEGNKDGGYSFKGASELPTLIGQGAKANFQYTYTYTDNDGDEVISTVDFNFTGLTHAEMENARNLSDTSADGVNDYFVGSSQADTIDGGKGSDTLIGNAGADTLRGGEGNDVLFYDKADTLIDGGAGTDILSLQAWAEFATVAVNGKYDTLAIDFSTVQNVQNVQNIERIEMSNDLSQTLKISASSVLSMTDSNNILFIDGDGGTGANADKFELTGFTKAGVSDQAGYQLYSGTANGSEVKLYLADDLTQVQII